MLGLWHLHSHWRAHFSLSAAGTRWLWMILVWKARTLHVSVISEDRWCRGSRWVDTQVSNQSVSSLLVLHLMLSIGFSSYFIYCCSQLVNYRHSLATWFHVFLSLDVVSVVLVDRFYFSSHCVALSHLKVRASVLVLYLYFGLPDVGSYKPHSSLHQIYTRDWVLGWAWNLDLGPQCLVLQVYFQRQKFTLT